MIRSMTGFGEAEHRLDDGVLRVRIKTVNHRFLNTNLRTPQGFERMEHDIQTWLRGHLSRGHVSVTVTVERNGHAADPEARIDAGRAERTAVVLRRLRDDLELEGAVDLASVLRFGDVFVAADDTEGPTVEAAQMRAAVDDAARAVVALREAEGARLSADMRERLHRLGEELGRIEAQAPLRLRAERDRLRTQIEELAATDDIDDDRLAREVAYLAEKWDINEEIVRFRSHLELFAETLDVDEPVGKRLSFVVQEMHREANTIGSKANDTEISHAVVAMKEEIERLREQVENVE